MNDFTHLAADSETSPVSAEGNVKNNPTDLPFDPSIDALASYVRSQGDTVPEGWEDLGHEPVQQEPLAADDSDGNVEAEEQPLYETTDPAEVPTDSELFSYTDLVNQNVKLEFDGKYYTPAQLKSVLGQENAAGTKAREASETLRNVQEREQQLRQAESFLNEKITAGKNVDQLAQLSAQYQELNTALQNARQEGDAYEMTMLQDRMGQIGQQYNQAEAQINHVKAQEQNAQYRAAKEGLHARGLGYLDETNDRSKAWVNYARGSLSENEFRTASMSPAFAEVVEKARRFDAASGKEGQKLTSKGTKTLRGGGVIPASQQQQNAALSKRVKEGIASPEDIHAYLLADGAKRHH